MRVAYLSDRYPDPALAFVRREALAVERLLHDEKALAHAASRSVTGRSDAPAVPPSALGRGELIRLSLREVEPGTLPDPADREEANKTLALDGVAWGDRLKAAVVHGSLHPLRWARAKLRLLALWGPMRAARAVPALLTAAWLARELKRRDVVHVHVHGAGEAAALAALVRALGGPPFSLCPHGPEDYAGLPAPPAAGDTTPQAVATSADASDAGDLFSGPDRRVPLKMRFAAFSVAMSEHHHRRLTANIHRKDANGRKRITLARPGLERELLDADPTPIPATPNAVFLGRFTPAGDPVTLLNAVSRMMSTTNLDVLDKVRDGEVLVMGDGPLREEVEAQRQRYKVQDWVRVVDWADDAGVCKAIRNARVVVVPSRAAGPPAEAVLAFALGRPVIATPVDGLDELVQGRGPRRNGWLVEPGDAHQLLNALREALTAPAEAMGQLAANSRAAVLEHHRVDDQARRLLPLFLQSERIEAKREAASLIAQARRDATA